jgi:hypothetical protein
VGGVAIISWRHISAIQQFHGRIASMEGRRGVADPLVAAARLLLHS